jgi:hypothetical protein
MAKNKKYRKQTQATPQNIQTASTYLPWGLWGTEATTQINNPTDARGWIQRYYDMLETDTVTRAFSTVLQLLLTSLTFEIKSNDEDDGDSFHEIAEKMFTDWAGGDFKDFLRNYVSTFLYGFSLFEMVLRKGETGYEVDDLCFHPQRYLTAKFKDSYTLEGFDSLLTQETIQLAQSVYAKGIGNFNISAYGESLLKPAYFHFKNKCFYLTKENRQVQINLEGVPIFTFDNTKKNKDNIEADKARLMAEANRYKAGLVTGLIMGSAPHTDDEGRMSNIKREDVRLMSVEGSKFIDTNTLIQREENSIARALMAGFLVMVGQDSGSYALSKDTTSMFKLLVEGIAQHLCDTFNHQVIKPLWVLNGQPFEYLPELTYDSVDLTLDGMATFINALSGAGIVLTESQEDYLFEYGGLPKPEAEERLKMQEDALMMNPMMQGNTQNEDISTDAGQQPRTTEDT